MRCIAFDGKHSIFRDEYGYAAGIAPPVDMVPSRIADTILVLEGKPAGL